MKPLKNGFFAFIALGLLAYSYSGGNPVISEILLFSFPDFTPDGDKDLHQEFIRELLEQSSFMTAGETLSRQEDLKIQEVKETAPPIREPLSSSSVAQKG